MAETQTVRSLRLTTNPGGLRWLIDSPRLSGAEASGKLTKKSRTIQFDTPDLRLYRRGIDLQVSQEGNRFSQRLGSEATGSDTPWLSETDGPEPALDRLRDRASRRVLDFIPDAELGPVLTWNVTRQSRVLQEHAPEGGSEVFELAFDEGEIETEGAPLPIAEVEVTLLKGPPAALYRLALELQQTVPLNIDPRTVFERGLPIIANRSPRWRPAAKPALSPDLVIDDAIAEVFRSGLRHFLANEGAALDGRDPEGIHQVRVALRRLRSAWSVFRPLVRNDLSERLRANAKWLANNLGPARDWDVFLTERFASIETGHPDDTGLSALRQHGEAARQGAYNQARAALLAQRTTTLVLELGLWIEQHGWHTNATTPDAPASQPASDLYDQTLDAFAAKSLNRQYDKVRKRGRHFEALAAERRHQLRIDVKKLRYMAEFFACAGNKQKAKSFIAATARLQDRLGELNDFSLLNHHLDALRSKAPDDADLAHGIGLIVGAAGSHTQTKTMDATTKAWRRFGRRKPFWKHKRR